MSQKTYMSMTRACVNCPFRVSVAPYIRQERAAEIAAGLLNDQTFTCHKTTVAAEDDDGDVEMMDGPNARHCAGALGTLLNQDVHPQMVRIAGRLGVLDPEKIDRDDLYPSLEEWVASYADPEAPEMEHCSIVGDACEDPPGFMFGGGAARNPNPGTVPEDQTCGNCGEPMCDGCTSETVNEWGDAICVRCEADNEGEDDD